MPSDATRGRRRPLAPEVLAPAMIIALGLVMRLPQLGHSLNEQHGFRQTQTALLARTYAASGIDLGHSPLSVFGPGSDVPFELPLVQAAGALPMRLGLQPDLSMRLVGLSGFAAVGVLLAVLMTRWHGSRPAWIAVLVLQLTPTGLAWGAASLIEFPAVALSMGMVAAIDSWFRGGRWWWLPAGGALAAAAFLVKATTGPVWCVLLVFAGLARLRAAGRWRFLAGLAAAGIPGVGAATLWTRYADRVKQGDAMTRWLTSERLHGWNFGTPSQRLDPDVYHLVWHRATTEMLGVFPLVLLGVVAALAVGVGGQRLLTAGWVASAVAGPLVLLNLYYVHNYYLCAIVPAVAALAALAIECALTLPTVRRGGRLTVAAVLAASLATSWPTVEGRADLRQWLEGRPVPAAAGEIAAVVPPSGTVVIIGCDWNPVIAYYARREAVYLRAPAFAAAYWREHRVEDSPWLYVCDPPHEPAYDPADYLPAGATAALLGPPGLFALVD